MNLRTGIPTATAYLATIIGANWAVHRYGAVPVGFGYLAPAGVYFVSHRPQPGARVELRDGQLTPNPEALCAIEPLEGGARARLIGIRF